MWLGASEGSFGAGRVLGAVEEGVSAGTGGLLVSFSIISASWRREPQVRGGCVC